MTAHHENDDDDAARQHHRHRSRGALIIVILALCLSLAGCAFIPTAPPTPTTDPTLPVVHATADQIAQAMEGDHFFSDYNGSSLLVQGTVASVSQQNGDSIVESATSVPTKVLCNLGKQPATVHPGDTITIQSADPQRDVSRKSSAVLIDNCRIVA